MGRGRPKGTLNRATVEVRNAARAIVEDPVYRMSLMARLLEGKAPHMEVQLWHYAYGKPKESVDGQDEGAVVFSSMSLSELAEQAEQIARDARAAADSEAQLRLGDGSVVDAVAVIEEDR